MRFITLMIRNSKRGSHNENFKKALIKMVIKTKCCTFIIYLYLNFIVHIAKAQWAGLMPLGMLCQ